MNRKRILLISYYFPPCGGAPVQRWHRFLPRLIEDGWDVSVLTTEGGDYPYLDPSLLNELPPRLKVYRTPVPTLSRIWKLLTGKQQELPHGDLSSSPSDPLLKKVLIWIRLNLVIPDMRVFWVPAALRKARELIPELGIRMVITTGPPHSTHLIGLSLKKRSGVTWIADWRDPWSGIHYLKLNPPTALSLKVHKLLEGSVCRQADLNLLISRHLSDSLPEGNKLVLRNGFDDESLQAARQATLNHPMASFDICYIGQLTAGQDLEALADILSEFRSEPQIRVLFIGSRLSSDQKLILDQRLGSVYEVLPFLPHREALFRMAAARVLVLLINRYEGFEGMLTTKLYEYLGTGVPILAIGPRGGEAEELIKAYNAGICVDRNEAERARQWIRERLQDYAAGIGPAIDPKVAELGSAFQSRLLIEALTSKIGIDKKSDDLVL